MKIHFLGIDLSKILFQLCGLSRGGKIIYTKRVRRAQLLSTLVQLEPCRIGIEACGGAYFWQREFDKLGHETKIINPPDCETFCVWAKKR